MNNILENKEQQKLNEKTFMHSSNNSSIKCKYCEKEINKEFCNEDCEKAYSIVLKHLEIERKKQ